jgi:hypothetical protein
MIDQGLSMDGAKIAEDENEKRERDGKQLVDVHRVAGAKSQISTTRS